MEEASIHYEEEYAVIFTSSKVTTAGNLILNFPYIRFIADECPSCDLIVPITDMIGCGCIEGYNFEGDLGYYLQLMLSGEMAQVDDTPDEALKMWKMGVSNFKKSWHLRKIQKSSTTQPILLFRCDGKAIVNELVERIWKSKENLKQHSTLSNEQQGSIIPYTSNSIFEIWLLGGPPNSAVKREENCSRKENKKENTLSKTLKHLKLNLTASSGALLTEDVATQIAPWISPHVVIKPWSLAYCSKIHGISYVTFYARCQNRGPCLMLIQDTKGMVFGAFVSCIRNRKSFYGSSDSFVFTNKATDGSVGSAVTVYRWSRENEYFVFSDSTCIVVGGPQHHAFSVCSQFATGESQMCTTYGSPTLSSSEEFEIRTFQIYVFN